MSDLDTYVKEQLQGAVRASGLDGKCEVFGWGEKIAGNWAVMWRPVGTEQHQSIGNESVTYRLGVALYGPSDKDSGELFLKHMMSPSAHDSLIHHVGAIRGWQFGDWEFGNEDPDGAGLKLGAMCEVTLEAFGEFVDDGITYVDTEIIFWDVENDEPFTGEITIDYKLTGVEGSIARVQLIDGVRPLGFLNSGGYDVVVAGGGDEPRLWTLEIDEHLEQVEYDGRTWDLWRLDAIVKDDALVRHESEPDAPRTSGQFGINIIPQFVAPATFYRFANKTLDWTWRNQNPEGTVDSEIAVYFYDNEEEWDGSTPLEFEVSRSDALAAPNEWTFVEEQAQDSLVSVRPTGGFHRNISFQFLPPSRMAAIALEEDGYDPSAGEVGEEDWYTLEFGVNNNAVAVGGDSVGDTHEGTLFVSVPNETIGANTYNAASMVIPWQLEIVA